MDYKKRVKGIINISDSSPYSITLEMIFINDANGRNFKNQICYWLNEKNIIIQFKDEDSELVNSVDIYFKNQGLFVIFLNNIFADFIFYDERKRTIIKNEDLITLLS